MKVTPAISSAYPFLWTFCFFFKWKELNCVQDRNHLNSYGVHSTYWLKLNKNRCLGRTFRIKSDFWSKARKKSVQFERRKEVKSEKGWSRAEESVELSKIDAKSEKLWKESGGFVIAKFQGLYKDAIHDDDMHCEKIWFLLLNTNERYCLEIKRTQRTLEANSGTLAAYVD